ncbi:MAG: hypothetical protein M3Q56_06085 [Bacteroidota bacterium]|nr:hypothetical protein [Bacteroidota bacterium]
MANDNKFSVLENVIEAQKGLMDTITENTKKISLNNPIINETIDKGSKAYKNILEKQKELMNDSSEKINDLASETKNSLETMSTFYKTWYENQVKMANQLIESNMNWFQMNNQNPFQAGNNMGMWNNWMNQANQPWMGMNNASNPMSFWMNSQNPFNNFQENINKATEYANQFGTQYATAINSFMGDWSKNFNNATGFDMFKGMMNTTESFAKFYEMWMPMMKSFQDKSFNMDVFKEHFNPEKNKEFMDKFFSFMPNGSKEYMDQITKSFTDQLKQSTGQGFDYLNAFKKNMNAFMPGVQQNPFSNIMSSYTEWSNMLENAASPLTKLMTPNNQTEAFNTWKEISEMMIQYNVKNAELQYLLYTTGTKSMETMAEALSAKMKNGEEISSIIKLYQEWLNNSDKIFAELFNSDDYSKLMTEVSSLQLKIKKSMDNQMEKLYFNHLPIATRTEMDEVYQNLYDLKKQVRKLEKMLSEEVETKTTTSKKSK